MKIIHLCTKHPAMTCEECGKKLDETTVHTDDIDLYVNLAGYAEDFKEIVIKCKSKVIH